MVMMNGDSVVVSTNNDDVDTAVDIETRESRCNECTYQELCAVREQPEHCML